VRKVVKWNQLNRLQRGEELWDQAGAQSVTEAVEAYGDVHKAAQAAVKVLRSDPEFEYEGDAAADIRFYLEHELGI
jgi:hypothetical protein